MNGQTHYRRNDESTNRSTVLPPRATLSADPDAAEFADYLRSEGERRRAIAPAADHVDVASAPCRPTGGADPRTWPGGMYRRAMMRAYAESIGLDRELALQQFEQASAPKQHHRVPPSAPPHALPAVPHAPPQPARYAAASPRRTPGQARGRTSRAYPRRAAASAVALIALLVVWRVVATSSVPPAAESPSVGAPATVERPATQLPAPDVPTASTPIAIAPAPEAAATRPTGTAGPVAPATRARNTARSPGASPAPVASTEGVLVVNSSPAGARVTVNGIGWGNTPLTIRHLDFGAKRIRLTMQGYVSDERVVSLAPHQPNGHVRMTLRKRP